MLHRERGRPELRHMPRPPSQRGNVTGILREEVPRMPFHELGPKRPRTEGARDDGDPSVGLPRQRSAQLCGVPYAQARRRPGALEVYRSSYPDPPVMSASLTAPLLPSASIGFRLHARCLRPVEVRKPRISLLLVVIGEQ